MLDPENPDSDLSKLLTQTANVAEMKDVIFNLQNGKAASSYHVTYEHIKYGGIRLLECITYLFNEILKQEYLPKQLKESLTITLHKGGGNTTKDPNN